MMFDNRRPATPEELARLIASFDASGVERELAEAQVSEIASLDQLAAMHTVLEIPDPPVDGDSFYTLEECARSWAAGGGSAHDQESYGRAMAQAAAPGFAPTLLFAPTELTSSGWWMVDGIHRAAALYRTRSGVGMNALRLSVFVLPRPL
jgi:hypothetical protein